MSKNTKLEKKLDYIKKEGLVFVLLDSKGEKVLETMTLKDLIEAIKNEK